MDTEPAKSSVISNSSLFSNFIRNNWITSLSVLVVLIAGLVGGYFIGQATIGDKYDDSYIKSMDSPLSLDLLRNKVITQWTGAVEGTLTAKSETSITIENKDGEILVIPFALKDDGSLHAFFFDGTKEYPVSTTLGEIPGRLTLDQLEVGSYLRGDFYVSTENNGQIFGNSFHKVEKP